MKILQELKSFYQKQLLSELKIHQDFDEFLILMTIVFDEMTSIFVEFS